MKLVYPEWKHQIEFREGEIPLLIIENPKLMYECVNEMNNQCVLGNEGKFVLSEEDQEISLGKKAYMIINPFDLDINNRKILSKLYLELKELSIDESLYIESNQLLSEMEGYLERLAEESDYNLEYDIDIDFSSLFKMFNLHLRKQSESLLETIVDYLEAMQHIMHEDICICLNLKCYLSNEEILKLYSMAEYSKINLIMIEARQPEKILKEEKIFIIDKMGCEIY